MAEYWKITCKDCGENFEYSDYILQMDKKRGQSRPERCLDCRVTHSSEIKSVGNSHFELTPIKGGPSILGVPFIGMIDHKGRTIPEKHDLPDNKVKMDLGLEDEEEDTIKKIYEEIDNHQIIIIVAATGTGKSTYLPFRLAFPLLYEKNKDPNKYLKYGPIVVTQPRIIATEAIPQTIAKNLVVSKVGEGFEIGYKHGEKRQKINSEEDDDENDASKTKKHKNKNRESKPHENYSFRNRLIFVTDGSLLNWISEGRIGQFSVIIIDEAHERSKNIDVILSLIQKELPKYPYLKLIILSATIDSKSFEDFFKNILNPDQIKVLDYTSDKYAIKKFKYEEVGDWKWVDLTKEEIEYKQNEKDERDARNILKDFEKSAPTQIAQKVVGLLDKKSEGGILAFLPGVKEIKECIEEIKRLHRIDESTKVFELHSSLSEEERDKAAEPFREEDKVVINGEKVFPRRVVIATNIAETSVTFDDVVHVIDSGLIKQSYWDSSACVQYMRTQFHSKDGCKQRWGRTGRKCNGFVYKLYKKNWFIRFFPHHTSPEIERCCLDDVFLNAIESGATDVPKLSWLTQPDLTEITRVNNVLSKRRLVDSDGDLTENGREVLRLRKSIGRILDQFDNSSSAFALDMAVLMVKADKFGCLMEAITLASIIPHLGASMHISEDKIEKNYNGFFIWNNKWDLISKDYVSRIQKTLQTGCNDDLDLLFKLSVIIDFYISKEVKIISDFTKKYFICETNISKYLAARELLLQKFIKGKKDESIRSLEYRLIQKLRILIPLALPDKMGKIIAQNDQLVFENIEGAKYLLSPNLSGYWKEGDNAVGLVYKQSPFIIEKNPETLLKNTPTAPYVEFLIRVQDSEFYHKDELNDYQALQYLKENLNESEEIRIRNLFIPMFALPGSGLKANAIINGAVSLKDIVWKPIKVKYDEVGLNQEDIDEIESEESILQKTDKLSLKIEGNKKVKKLFNETKSIHVSYNSEVNYEKYFIEKWVENEESAFAYLTDASYYLNKTHQEISDKDYVGVTLHHEINDCLYRNIAGYLCRYKNQYFPVPIENITIEPLVPFQESLIGKSLYLYNFKIKSLPFYYGLVILPKIEANLKRMVVSRNMCIKLIAIKKDNKTYDSWAFFKTAFSNNMPVYLSTWYRENYNFNECIDAIISFKINREKVIEKELVSLNIQESTKVLQLHNFVYENGEIKFKDLRPISQFIDVFDKLFAINQNFSIYRTIRRLYTKTYNIEIQMEALFDKIIKKVHNLTNKLGSITESDRESFQQEISDFQSMLRTQKPYLQTAYDQIDSLVSSMWNLDMSEVKLKKLNSNLSFLMREIDRTQRDGDNEKALTLTEKKNKVENQLNLLTNIRDGHFETIESCRQFIIDQFNLPGNYGVTIVGPSEEFQTIQSAINAAANGDLILIKDGQYQEAITINKNISIQSVSNNRDNVVITSKSKYTIIVHTDNVSLSGITIEQEGIVDELNYMHAAVFNRSKSLLLDNCTIKTASNVCLENTGNIYIYQSSIYGNKDDGAGVLTMEDSSLHLFDSNITDCACGIYSKNSHRISMLESTISTDVGITFEGTRRTLYDDHNNLLDCRVPLCINAPVRRNNYGY